MLFLPTGCRQADSKQTGCSAELSGHKGRGKSVEISESYSAAIRGRQDVDILPQISRRIIRLKVKEGERVKTGQSIGVIDQVPPYRAALRTAQANVPAQHGQSGNGKNRAAGQAGIV